MTVMLGTDNIIMVVVAQERCLVRRHELWSEPCMWD